MTEHNNIPKQDVAAVSAKARGKSLFFQPKLSINQPNDVYEQEADAVADKVMLMREPSSEKKFFSPPVIQRKCAHCEEEEKKVQRKENSEVINALPYHFIQRQTAPPTTAPAETPATTSTPAEEDPLDFSGLITRSASLLERYTSEPQRPPVPPFEAITGSVQGYTSYGRMSSHIPGLWSRRSVSFTDAARGATGESTGRNDTGTVREGTHSNAEASASFSPRWAIVFSAWNYATWSDVPFVREIVRTGSPFQRALQSEFGHVTNVENPTGANIRSGIGDQITGLQGQLIPGRIAELMIYFEGHGGGGGICGVDDQAQNNCVDFPELQTFAQTASRAGIHVTFILDSCNIGEIVNLAQRQQASSVEARMTAGGATVSPEAAILLADIRNLLNNVIPLGHSLNTIYGLRSHITRDNREHTIQPLTLNMMQYITDMQNLSGLDTATRFIYGTQLINLCMDAENAVVTSGLNSFHTFTIADITRMRNHVAPLIDLTNQQINVLLQQLEQLAPPAQQQPASPQLVPDHDPNQTPEGVVV